MLIDMSIMMIFWVNLLMQLSLLLLLLSIIVGKGRGCISQLHTLTALRWENEQGEREGGKEEASMSSQTSQTQPPSTTHGYHHSCSSLFFGS